MLSSVECVAIYNKNGFEAALLHIIFKGRGNFWLQFKYTFT